VNQTAAQPCFLDNGAIPTDGKPCRRRVQPAFNGRQAFYNSGFVKYGGNNGNHFKVRLANDTPTGEYFFYCLVHGVGMGGFIQVKPNSVSVPSQGELNKRALGELDKVTARLKQGDRAAKRGKDKPAGVDIVSGAEIAGFALPFGTLLEYYPKTFTAKVGQKITWTLNGHTVSFHVPKYVPIVFIDKDGTLRPNPITNDPVNAPKPPEPHGGGEHDNGPPPPPTKIDAGNYDGSKFISSGTNDNEWFSLTFTKAGTYQYACLIHPRMVGTVIVK
jgi:plastocyanin